MFHPSKTTLNLMCELTLKNHAAGVWKIKTNHKENNSIRDGGLHYRKYAHVKYGFTLRDNPLIFFRDNSPNKEMLLYLHKAHEQWLAPKVSVFFAITTSIQPLLYSVLNASALVLGQIKSARSVCWLYPAEGGAPFNASPGEVMQQFRMKHTKNLR